MWETVIANAAEAALTALLLALVPILVYLVKRGLTLAEAWVSSKLGTDTMRLFETMGLIAVQAAAQQPGLSTNEERKDFAVETLQKLAEGAGLPLSDDLSGRLVESMYRAWKDGYLGPAGDAFVAVLEEQDPPVP